MWVGQWLGRWVGNWLGAITGHVPVTTVEAELSNEPLFQTNLSDQSISVVTIVWLPLVTNTTKLATTILSDLLYKITLSDEAIDKAVVVAPLA